MVDARKTHKLYELSKYRLLVQSSKSGTGLYIDQWLAHIGVKLTGNLSSSNMLALIGMAVSGLGVTYLPFRCLRPMIDAGMLATFRVTPTLPDTPYVAIYKREERSAIVNSVLVLAQEACDFSRMFQQSRQ
jgi:DNA-binding transcriptional LysR family regulator